VHLPLFLPALDRADQREGLNAIRPDTGLGVQAVAHGLPVAPLGERAGPLLELALGGADQVASPRFEQPLQVVLARHAAVGCTGRSLRRILPFHLSPVPRISADLLHHPETLRGIDV
jgi:hypothetical protein